MYHVLYRLYGMYMYTKCVYMLVNMHILCYKLCLYGYIQLCNMYCIDIPNVLTSIYIYICIAMHCIQQYD